MAKFFFFEKIVQLFYTHVFTEPKETYSKGTQLGVTFASGYLAGVVCAIADDQHPGDGLSAIVLEHLPQRVAEGGDIRIEFQSVEK